MNKHSTERFPAELSATDQCVLCGICSTLCPSYQQNPIEASSPRGRISIIQTYLQQPFELSKTSAEHIQHCLGCNLCQDICPSKVPFESIIDNFKTLAIPGNSWSIRLLLKYTSQARGLNRFKKLFRMYQISGLALISRLFLRSASAQQAQQILRCIDNNTLQTQIAPQKKQTTIGLFIGCSGELFDTQTLNDVINMLNHLNIKALIPSQPLCCGALHQHNGQIATASLLKKSNIDYFHQHGINQVIYSSNGCGRQLLKHAQSNIQFIDVMSFIYPLITEKTQFTPLNSTVILHNSCSNSALGETNNYTRMLLSFIPEINLIDINHNNCCGAGGSNLLQFPDIAGQILAERISKIKKLAPLYLVSDNIGCSLHYKIQLAKHGIKLDVIHPITLLAKQLIQSS